MKRLTILIWIIALLVCISCDWQKTQSYSSEVGNVSGVTTTIGDTTATTINDTSEVGSGVQAAQYFWGTWVKMSDGAEYVINETDCRYSSSSKHFTSSTDTALTVSDLGTFTKHSDSVMVMDSIPYYRKGGANLEYSIRVVGFTDSRSGGTVGQADKRVTGKSHHYASYTSETKTDSEGVARLIAPTVNDIQTVTVEDDNGRSVTVSDINVERNQSNMGTIALVGKDQYNLKVTGTIDDRYKADGYMFVGRTYPMTLTITNISDITATTSILTIESDNPAVTVVPKDNENLSAMTVGTLAGGGTKILNLGVTCSDIDAAHIDAGIKVTIENVAADQIWVDYVPMRFYRQTVFFTVKALSPDNNDDAELKGFIIYPDGNSQYFSVGNNQYSTIEVPEFGDDEPYLMAFCGATPNSGLYSTEMYYTVICGQHPLDINLSESGTQLAEYILFGEPNNSQPTAHSVTSAFQAYLHAEDIDYYRVTANNNNKVIFNLDNQDADSAGSANVIAVLGETLSDITVPTKTGYIFGGYWTEQNGCGEQYIDANGNGVKVIDNMEERALYAKWTAITYTVVYDNNSGSGSMENQSMSYDVSADLYTVNFYKTGYTFLGWSIDQNAVEPLYTNHQTVGNLAADDGASVRLYAVWQANSYTVVFDANGGNGEMSSQSMTYDIPISLNTCAYTKDGYSFAGWSKNKNIAVAEYDDEESVSDVTAVNGNVVTLYAVWGIRHIVHYNDNSCDENMDDQYITDGQVTDLYMNAFTKTGYTFVGWSTVSGGNAVYTDGQSVSNLSTTDEVVNLYAVWEANTYTIVFDANGGSGEMSDLDMTYGVSVNLTTNGYIKTGCGFKSWNTKADGTGTDYADGVVVSNLTDKNDETIVLYAQWGAIYTVQFDSNGGTGDMADLGMIYGVPVNLTANSYIKTGYGFKSWNTKADGTGVDYDDKAVVSNLTTYKTIRLYAIWYTSVPAVGHICYEDNDDKVYSNSYLYGKTPIGIVFGVGNKVKIIHLTQSSTFLKWCKLSAAGYKMSVSTSTSDGSGNWQIICDNVFDENVAGNYPAFEYVNGLGSEWYLPAIDELKVVYANITAINASLIILRNAGVSVVTLGTQWYWSSSTKSNVEYAYCYGFRKSENGGGRYDEGTDFKTSYDWEYARAVMAF